MDRGSLIDELSAVFSAATLVYGDQKSTTTISMMVPVLQHGMIIVCAPEAVSELTQSGGSYGLRRSVGPRSNKEISELDTKITRALGKRISELTQKL
jgi:NAD(P)H dehydrogenase (quinone)